MIEQAIFALVLLAIFAIQQNRIRKLEKAVTWFVRHLKTEDGEVLPDEIEQFLHSLWNTED